MKFSEELDRFMKELDITANDLSRQSELSPDVISRYLNDKRSPKADSEYFDKLVNALYEISRQKENVYSIDEIRDSLAKSLINNKTDYNYSDFVDNFNILQKKLNLSNANLGKALGYDSSYISRIKTGSRKPTDIDAFIDEIVNYIVGSYHSNEKIEAVARLLEVGSEDINTEEKYKNKLKTWLKTKHSNYDELIQNFLIRLDDFKLSDFMNEDFSKVKTHTTPIVLSKGKTYYGVKGRKASEEDFKKRYVLAVSMLLKKGLRMNIVHNIDRPLEEMILGLENWLPMYMTGSISPYYFPTQPSNLFCTSHMTSGSVALSGECMKNNQEKAKFYVTTRKEELPYYKAKSRYMLKKAKPLMKIYTADENDKFEEFLRSEDSDKMQMVSSSNLKNMDFIISKKWIALNKKISPNIHFVVYNEKLNNAIKAYLLG